MLIRFDLSVEFLQSEPPEKVADIFSEIARSYRRGRHVVSIPRNVVSWAVETLDLDERACAALKAIGMAYTQIGALHHALPIFCRVMPNGVALERLGNAVNVPFERFASSNILETPILLVEDAVNDTDIYAEVLDGVRRKLGISALMYEASHGGGSGVARLIGPKCLQERGMAVVLDSDVLSAKHRVGKKLRAHQKLLDEAMWPLHSLFCLPCREIENILPYAAVECLNLQPEHKRAIEHLKAVEQKERSDGVPLEERLRFYFDMKAGIQQSKISKLRTNGAQDWWREKVGDEDFSGFGDRLARQIAQSNRAMSELGRAIFSDEWIEHFVSWFSEIAWLFAGAKQQRL